jgi:hypothetical protein
MVDILNNITQCIDDYESGTYLTKEKLLTLNRRLSSNIYYLTKYNIEAFEKFNSIIYNSNNSVARATCEAHEEVKELRHTRKILEACKNVSISINNELSIIKNEN